MEARKETRCKIAQINMQTHTYENITDRRLNYLHLDHAAFQSKANIFIRASLKASHTQTTPTSTERH